LFESLAHEDKLNMVIAYMDYLYKQGERGDKITSKLTGIKQMLILSRKDATFLDDATIEQARKSCRFTTLEQHQEAEKFFTLSNSPSVGTWS
jgi:hypothetical protein